MKQIFNISTNDTFNVCLTVNNYLGSDVYCTDVIISSYLPPVSGFSYTVEDDSIVHFVDESLNAPDEWSWDFGYNSESSVVQDPDFIYPHGGTYHVCLTTANIIGAGDISCEDIVIVLTGIENIGVESQLEIFPQPLVNTAIISHPDFKSSKIQYVKMFDMLGKRVDLLYTEDNNKIIVYRNNLISGVYIIEIVTDNMQMRGKLLVE